ncbi:MAG: hypothetical protein K1X79_12945 [Oligoflexia bacterium]|nr:hypothetical protein [Oligoflexia bacterium]
MSSSTALDHKDFEQDSAEQQGRSMSTNSWRSLLLQATLTYLWFLSVSGFALFFARPFLASSTNMAQAHWLLGIAGLLPYSVYQLRHYRHVRSYTGQVHYQVGLCLLGSTLLTIITGIALIWVQDGSDALALAHVMTSFALLILLVAHLALVIRLNLRRASANQIGPSIRSSLVLPVIIGSILALALVL